MSSADGLALSWVDVFTDRPFAGNPLAVVPDGDRVPERQMQPLAREIGLSETVFVTNAGRRLRIFTPTMELPLAGHPTVGTAVELARLGRIPAQGVTTFETGAGPIDVECSGSAATMTQAAPRLGGEVDRKRAARLLQLDERDIVGQPAFCTTTGVAQAFVQVRGRDTLGGIRPDLDEVCTLAGADGVAAWCEHGDELAQRFFAPQMGVNEDPATGSAAGALAALRVFQGGEPGAAVVRQGEEIGRPSTIHVEVPGERGAPGPPRVGGNAVLVLEATVPAATLASAGG